MKKILLFIITPFIFTTNISLCACDQSIASGMTALFSSKESIKSYEDNSFKGIIATNVDPIILPNPSKEKVIIPTFSTKKTLRQTAIRNFPTYDELSDVTDSDSEASSKRCKIESVQSDSLTCLVEHNRKQSIDYRHIDWQSLIRSGKNKELGKFLKAIPPSFIPENEQGQNPAHVAVMKVRGGNAILKILTIRPDLVTHRDKKGLLPQDYIPERSTAKFLITYNALKSHNGAITTISDTEISSNKSEIFESEVGSRKKARTFQLDEEQSFQDTEKEVPHWQRLLEEGRNREFGKMIHTEIPSSRVLRNKFGDNPAHVAARQPQGAVALNMIAIGFSEWFTLPNEKGLLPEDYLPKRSLAKRTIIQNALKLRDEAIKKDL